MTTPSRPTARVARVHPNPTNPGHVLLNVTCPHCGRTHVHGAATDEGPDYGHRTADCGARGGYTVTGHSEASR